MKNLETAAQYTEKMPKIMEISGLNKDKDMADKINNFFADIGPNLAEDIPDSLLDMDYNFTGVNHLLNGFTPLKRRWKNVLEIYRIVIK